ncbi:hypothetical protein HYZ06_01290 [Candidatus Daviesbacteria bacterium]|nr:hypothetical protein [Candidatus Daviesbacteria bacterium]
MSKAFLKIFSALIFWGILILVLVYIPYPESLTSATPFQILIFFIPLFLALTFTLNLFFKFVFSSASISLGIVFLLLLKALDALNFVSAALTIVAVGLLLSYFKKERGKRHLTSVSKISKLTSLHRKKQ